MKRMMLAATAVLSLTAPADAGQYGLTHFPAHWLLDRGPRVITVPPYVSDGRPLDTPSARDSHAEEDRAAVARAQQRSCQPVRVWTEDGSFTHRAAGCRH